MSCSGALTVGDGPRGQTATDCPRNRCCALQCRFADRHDLPRSRRGLAAPVTRPSPFQRGHFSVCASPLPTFHQDQPRPVPCQIDSIPFGPAISCGPRRGSDPQFRFVKPPPPSTRVDACRGHLRARRSLETSVGGSLIYRVTGHFVLEQKKNVAGLALALARAHISGMAPRRAGASYVFRLSRPASGPVQIASSIVWAPLASHAGGFAALRQHHAARCATVYTTTSNTNAHRRTAGAEMPRVSALIQCSAPTRGGSWKTSSTSPPRT